MAIRKDSKVQVKRLLLGVPAGTNVGPYYHGLVGDIKPAKSNYNVIVLSGGGIDSFMSTRYAVELISRINRWHDHTIDRVDDAPDYEINLHFMVFDYGQDTYEVELHMTQQQANYLINKNSVNNVNVLTVTDGLMEIIRNPLANRTKEKQDAEENNANYAANDDYVPNRNARFVFNAAGYAETIDADMIVIGAVGNVNQDNSMVFLEAAHKAILQSNRDCFPALYAPFVLQSKSMVALAAQNYAVLDRLPYLSTSCFDASETTTIHPAKKVGYKTKYIEDQIVKQCGVCRSCTSLKQAFKFAGVADPYVYRTDEVEQDNFVLKEEPETKQVFAKKPGKTVQETLAEQQRQDKLRTPKKKPVTDVVFADEDDDDDD